MGYQRRVHGDLQFAYRASKMFRFAVVVCSAALVAAEADPLLLGAGYSGLGLGYAGAAIAAPAIAAVPAIATTAFAAPIAVAKSAPCVNAANIPVPCNAGAVLAAPAIATTGVIGGYSTLGGHYYGKREAEAEPYLGYAGLGYGY